MGPVFECRPVTRDQAVAEILDDAAFAGIEIRSDLTGRDRIAIARRPA